MNHRVTNKVERVASNALRKCKQRVEGNAFHLRS
jgi:hypothetical protein